MTSKTYRIVATKRRDGQRIEGTTKWDGLSAILAVKCADGQVRYVSSLDTWEVFEEVAA